MSGSGHARAPGGRPPMRDDRRGAVAVVAVAASLVALALGGQGLLVPAGPSTTVVRAGGALLALGAVSLLVRLDRPARGARTLALVAVAGALVALATLPASPVTLGQLPAPVDDGGATGADGSGAGTITLDRVDPPGAEAPTLAVPPGARPLLEGEQVLAEHPDGTRSVLGPAAPGTMVESADGTVVVVGEGALLEVPDPIPAEPAVPDPLDDRVEALLALLLGAFALLAFSPPVARLASRTVEPVDAVDPARTAAAPPVRRVEDGLAGVLRAMLADPDPRTAVVGAYARLLLALADAGVPRLAHEGPHEHLWRALGPLGVRPGPVHRLAELFVRARFTPHPMTGAHRRAAIGALADAVADLRLQVADVRDGDVRALLAGSGS